MSRAARTAWRGEDFILRLEREGQTLHEERASRLALPLAIGRKVAAGWAVPPEERSVSGVHAEVYMRRGRLRVRDCGSRNGLFVMGRRVSDVRLAPGVQVSLGGCRLVAEADARAPGGRLAPHHRLERLNGGEAGRFLDLKAEVTPVGSGVGEGVFCASLLVSKHHADLLCKPDGSCWVRDGGSRNGTRVNGVPLARDTERMLRHRDVVAFADCEFRFWDRAKDDSPWNLARKAFVAVATMAVCGTLYFVVQTVSPSARHLLATEEGYERAGQFAVALAILDKVPGARGGEAYADEVARRRANIGVWQDTLTRWREVKEALGRRYWVDASKDLGTLLASNVDRWGWNTTTAQAEKRKAAVLQEVLEAFLSARAALGGTFAAPEQGRERQTLAARLQAMEAALARDDWPVDAPTDDLRADMQEQVEAVRAVVADLSAVAAALARIARPQTGDLQDVVGATQGFEREIARLEALQTNAVARNRRRADEAAAARRRFVSSAIVEETCEVYLPVLRQFVAARQVLEANGAALAALDYAALQPKLPLPSDFHVSALPAFGDIRQALQEANARLCGPLRRTLEDQAGRLARLKVAPVAPPPPCVAALLDQGRMARVFACDTLDPRSPPPSPTRTRRVGEYDAVLGMEEFGAFLQSVEHTRELAPVEGADRPLPALVEALQLYQQVERFSASCRSADVRHLLSLAPPGGNRLRQLAAAVADLRRKRGLLVDLWWNHEADDRRARLIACGAALALDGADPRQQRLGEDEVAAFLKDRADWRTEITRLDRLIRDDPLCVDEVRPRLLRLAVPGLSAGRAIRHWTDAANAAGGGR